MSKIEKPKLANPELKNGIGIGEVWELFRKYKFNSFDRRTACLSIELAIMLVGFKDESDSIIDDFERAKKSLFESESFKSMPSF